MPLALAAKTELKNLHDFLFYRRNMFISDKSILM